LRNTKKRINVLVGGAGSSKSWSIAQHIILNLCNQEDKRILIVRKVRATQKASCWQLIRDLLQEYRIPYEINKSELLLQVRNNAILFLGMDDPEKKKSIEFGNYIWIEEATELTYEDFLQLKLRLRRKTDTKNQIFLSFNPVSSLSWIKRELIDTGDDNVAVDYSTYKDNPFLSQDYKDELEKLKGQDENYYQIYTLGKWGILKNIIYSNWDITEKWPSSFDEIIYGLDFGFNNPSALLEIGIKDQEYYERELLYESGLTNADLIGKLENLVPKDAEIYGDSEAPEKIEEIGRAGFNVHPSEKGKNSVKNGIDFVKRLRVHVHKGSTNLINEKRSYKYKEDKDGNVLEEPVKFRDHLMDSERYAIYTHGQKVEPRLINPWKEKSKVEGPKTREDIIKQRYGL
jgi:phage terminase large subunit